MEQALQTQCSQDQKKPVFFTRLTPLASTGVSLVWLLPNGVFRSSSVPPESACALDVFLQRHTNFPGSLSRIEIGTNVVLADALEGMRNTLETYAPDLSIPFHPESWDDILAWLQREAAYKVLSVHPGQITAGHPRRHPDVEGVNPWDALQEALMELHKKREESAVLTGELSGALFLYDQSHRLMNAMQYQINRCEGAPAAAVAEKGSRFITRLGDYLRNVPLGKPIGICYRFAKRVRRKIIRIFEGEKKKKI